MGLYRRKGSPFWWMWLEPPVGGTPTRESTKIRHDGPTPEIRKRQQQLAEQVYHRRLVEFQQSAAGLAPRPSIAFDAYAQWYADHVCATHGSVARERSAIKRLRAWFGSRSLNQIDREAVIEWRTARLAEKVAPSTADRELDVLKAILASAVPKYLPASPIAGLKRHRETVQAKYRRPRILSHDEEARLLKAARDPVEYAIVVLALDTLMRLSDVRTLRRDRDYGTVIHVEAPKVQPYDVPVSRRLRKALDALPADGPYYFPRRWSGPESALSPNTIWRIFKRLCEAAKVPFGRKNRGMTFHGLRHTGTTRLLEAGTNPVAVRDIGGWLSIRQLDRYGRSSEETRRKAVELIGRKPR